MTRPNRLMKRQRWGGTGGWTVRQVDTAVPRLIHFTRPMSRQMWWRLGLWWPPWLLSESPNNKLLHRHSQLLSPTHIFLSTHTQIHIRNINKHTHSLSLPLQYSPLSSWPGCCRHEDTSRYRGRARSGRPPAGSFCPHALSATHGSSDTQLGRRKQS